MIRGKQRRPIETGAECFAPGIRAALVHLLEADVYARDVGANPWDFAVEIDDLMALGLTKGHLRWLIKKNYVQHAREVTKPKDSVRVFQSIQNLVFSKATCFILADAGRLLVKPDNTLSTGPRLFSTGDAATPAPVSVPHWDGGRRSLCVGGQLIKRYLVPSPTQEVILTAFEEEGWPYHIDDPLSPEGAIEPKYRLHDTIKRLNRHHKTHIIRFWGDGTGEGVCWGYREEVATLALPAATGPKKKPRLAA